MGKFRDLLKDIWKDLGEDVPDEETESGLPTDGTAAIEAEYDGRSRGQMLRHELKRRRDVAQGGSKEQSTQIKRGRPRKEEEPERGE